MPRAVRVALWVIAGVGVIVGAWFVVIENAANGHW